jgi:glycosyltransferase involved in cell wall biosynthesis
MKPILAFYMGYSDSFNGQNYNSKNVYGSEINTIKLAEALIDIYDIYIFVNIPEEEEIVYNNVTYLNSYKLNDFKKIDIMVIVRYINYFIYFRNIASKVYIWICDMIINPAYKGLLIEATACNLINSLKPNINGLICLSEWHAKNIDNTVGIKDINTYLISNPLDLSYYKPNIPIIKNRFIFTSDISRGLDILLDCLIYIQKYIPDISLVVFRKHMFTNNIKNKIKLLNNVFSYNKESQDKLAFEYLQAEFFFYPTNFHETFCNCAAEAQLYHCVCIYNNIGGLSTTIADRGLSIDYDINNINYIENTCKDVIELMNNTQKKIDYLYRGHEWAKSLDINKLKNDWIYLFNN